MSRAIHSACSADLATSAAALAAAARVDLRFTTTTLCGRFAIAARPQGRMFLAARNRHAVLRGWRGGTVDFHNDKNERASLPLKRQINSGIMPAMPTVTLETGLGDDWRRILKTDRLRTLANAIASSSSIVPSRSATSTTSPSDACSGRAVAGGL
jgi:hypothetical protein